MSVKHQRNPRLNSSVRDLRENLTSLQSTNSFQYVNCIGNKIEFHKKLIITYSLHLSCTTSKQTHQQSPPKIPQSPTQQIEYTFEIEGMNLYVIKSLVKHSFSLDKYVNEKCQFLRIQFPQEQKIAVLGCSIGSSKGVKVLQISDEYRMKNCNNVGIINPVQLIQENMRLRAIKLNRSATSATKTINFNSQSVKKLNFNWNKQTPKESRDESPTRSNWRPKRQLQNQSFSNSICEIKGVPFKKSVQKCEALKQRSVSKINKDLSLRNIKSTNILQRSTQRQNNPVDSKIKKNLQASFTKQNQKTKNIGNQSNYSQDISSQSYYTAKKKLQDSFQVQLQNKKKTQTSSKENLIQTNCSFGSKTNSKFNNTEYRNYHRQSQANILSSYSNMDPQKFRKNISQVKIAQISRTLLQPKNKN